MTSHSNPERPCDLCTSTFKVEERWIEQGGMVDCLLRVNVCCQCPKEDREILRRLDAREAA